MELQIYKNAEFGSVRTTTIGGQPYFVGKDVTDILPSFSRTRKSKKVSRGSCKSVGRDFILLKLNALVHDFFKSVITKNIDIYNEFSLQHELGIFLREALPTYKVQFERNVSYFNNDNKTIKKEIDIAVFSEDKAEKYAIELKCPLNGQYPEQMYSFVKDIKFMEQLKERGFTNTCCVVLVSDRPFYQGKSNEGIYKYFREEFSVYGEIFKPTGLGRSNESITLSEKYNFEWQELSETRRYYIIEI